MLTAATLARHGANFTTNLQQVWPKRSAIFAAIAVSLAEEQGVKLLAGRKGSVRPRTGIGIPPREQKRIFRRFYRVDQRLARETAGSGLGLSIVDAIVRAHGGWVRVSSRPEHGSTFAVYVPCATGGVPA